LRAGYIWTRTPVSDRNFTPAFPDSNGHVVTTGVGFTCKPGGRFFGLFSCGEPGKASRWRHTGLDFSYQAILWETRIVAENPNPAVNGRYRSLTQALTLSLRLAF